MIREPRDHMERKEMFCRRMGQGQLRVVEDVAQGAVADCAGLCNRGHEF